MNYSDSESSSSSAASPSPPTSPCQQQGSAFQAGQQQQQPPSLERLVLHFVAAKKALSVTQHVYRATELASSSRALVEEISALNAKTSYARRGVDEQLETLREIRGAIAGAGEKASDEFTATIANLDVANDRLQVTLDTLRDVIPKRELQKKKKLEGAAGKERHAQHLREVSPDDEAGNEDGVEERTLYDYIDEANHEGLLASLRELIDTFKDSHDDLGANLARFDDSIASIVDAAQGTDDDSHGSSNPPSKITPYDEPPLPIPALYHDMESHAAEMATLLHSLISHYDLCVSALKHTEGGGEAAREAVRATEDTAAAKNAAGVEESLYGATIPDPMDADERAEMLRVLENDAAEVEDVVGELRERGGEMEGLYAQLNLRAEIARRSMSGLRRAVEIMRTVQSALPIYLDAITGFGEGWANVRLAMQEKTQELFGLCEFYENFWASYNDLLREVGRRAVLEAKMVKVAEKARADLEALAEADGEARQDFVDTVGGFLPQDIWPGLAERGSRWVVERVADDGVERVADVVEEVGESGGDSGDERCLMEG
jgi:autophagy-related protein 17